MEDSFEQFVRGSTTQLLRTALLLTGERGAAEDLVQDVLERTYRHWRRVEDPHAYARVVMARRITDRWRIGSRRVREVQLQQWHDEPVSDGTQARAQRAGVEALLRQLPPRQRAVVVLRYFEDWSEARIAEELGCSAGTVKSNCSRGLSRLRQLMSVEDKAREAAR
ncbi:RNA polymerase sigma-70 factor (sigma-E family) [Kineococcus xinjiangensis]|uniref:RNA polymerase sigma-70 factor (Sigma-E family) n=1 Tax=Kineococcus xinjiangensis TaxID=512762 RepID=A0A2S6IWQ7_9ACTN|nr:SigE family RNA polymerase sigma factor [Kineococcus xinjiangensis]PPK98591.1 RNA polymerase sigma-70 factor (sigma-E family) [Kineococcus xinjiangensis]